MKRSALLLAVAVLLALGTSPLRSAHAAQILTNTGFESGSTGWQQYSVNGYALVDPTKPRTGSYSAWFCGYANCDDRLWQTVTLPTGISSATLSYWTYVSTTTSNSCSDTLVAQVRTVSGTAIASGSATCNSTPVGWVQRTIDFTSALTPYSGGSVQVFFRGTTISADITSFFLDDVALTIGTTTASASTTPTAVATKTATPGPTSTSTAPAPAPTNTSPAPTPVPTSTSSTTGTQCTGSTTQSACIQYMLNKLNTDRAQNGVAPLTLNATLTNGTSTCVGAYGHSVHMASVGTISHDQFPADICTPYMTAGENVGVASMGTETGDLNTIDSQMMAEPHSPGCSGNHACNILNPNFHQIGIGLYRVNNTTWLTEDFTN